MAIEFDKQDIEIMIQTLEYIKFGTYLEGNYLEDGLEQILSKMKELQGESKVYGVAMPNKLEKS